MAHCLLWPVGRDNTHVVLFNCGTLLELWPVGRDNTHVVPFNCDTLSVLAGEP